MWVEWMGQTLRVPEPGERKQHHSNGHIYEVIVVTNLISTTANSTAESRIKFPPEVVYRDVSQNGATDPFSNYSRGLEVWDTNFKELDSVVTA